MTIRRVRPGAAGVRTGARLRPLAAVAAVGLGLGLAACGSSAVSGHVASGSPRTLLRETFAASHTVKSGVLDFSLRVTPQGSSIAALDRPLTLSLDGPFQSRGHGRTPESAFTIGFSGLGRQGSFGVRTTAAGAYVSVAGANYALPAADDTKLGDTLAGSSGAGATPGLASLGIDPETWLSDPRIVGTQTVGGVLTEHLHSGVDVPALVRSIDRVLAREEPKLGRTVPRIAPATASRIGSELRDPSVDVYTGKADATLRQLTVSATLPVSGTDSTRLGGLTALAVQLTIGYSQLNQPQTIASPANPRSYASLQRKLQSIGSALESSLGAGLGGTGTGASTGTGGSATGGAAATGSVDRYSRCINGAHDDVTKMQRCAKLLKSGG